MALESSPEVLNSLLAKLGAPGCFKVHDVFGTDVSDLEAVPGSIKAIILLLPKDEKYNQRLEEKNADVGEPKIFFIHQANGKFCGTSALIHAVVSGNNHLELDDCPLKRFLDEAQSLSAAERGDLLEKTDEIVAAHNEAVAEGESGQVDEPNHHLICFVRVGDQVYDMDNKATKPQWVAECNDDTFPEEAIKAAKAYMDRNPDSHEFNILALVTE